MGALEALAEADDPRSAATCVAEAYLGFADEADEQGTGRASWAMVAMSVSVIAVFLNSLWGQPARLLGAITSVGSLPGSPTASRDLAHDLHPVVP